jgi:hypothetical protein
MKTIDSIDKFIRVRIFIPACTVWEHRTGLSRFVAGRHLQMVAAVIAIVGTFALGWYFACAISVIVWPAACYLYGEQFLAAEKAERRDPCSSRMAFEYGPGARVMYLFFAITWPWDRVNFAFLFWAIAAYIAVTPRPPPKPKKQEQWRGDVVPEGA